MGLTMRWRVVPRQKRFLLFRHGALLHIHDVFGMDDFAQALGFRGHLSGQVLRRLSSPTVAGWNNGRYLMAGIVSHGHAVRSRRDRSFGGASPGAPAVLGSEPGSR